jgi:hypothetical protein
VAFINIVGYVSKKSNDTEVQDVLVNIGVSYGNAKAKDLETVKGLDVSTLVNNEKGITIDLLEQAKTGIVNSLIAPNKAMSDGQSNAYIIIGNGLKIHKEMGTVYVYGMRERKTEKVPGVFGKDTRRPLTVAKDEIRKLMRTSKYREYLVERIDKARANGDTITFGEGEPVDVN